jgi:hypothetical protein
LHERHCEVDSSDGSGLWRVTRWQSLVLISTAEICFECVRLPISLPYFVMDCWYVIDTLMKNDPSTSSQDLSQLIAFDAEGRAVCPSQELHRSIMAYQFAQSPILGLLKTAPRLVHQCRVNGGESIRTFADLFHHRRPPLELLRWAKDFAKGQYDDRNSPMPPDVLLLVYYGSIVVAMMRYNRRITRLEEDDLRSGFNWAVRQPWIDHPTFELFQEGLRFLRSPRRQWRM